MINHWIFYAFSAVVAWGLWGFFPKLATIYISPKSALVWEVLGALLVGLLMLPLVGFRPETQPKGILFAILTGVFAMLGGLAFLFAISRGKASIVVTMTALYPIVVILLSYFLLHESITVKQTAGIVLALVAVTLLV